MTRAVLLVVHTGRRAAVGAARGLANRLHAAGVQVRALSAEAPQLRSDDITVVDPAVALGDDVELVVALGGDGSLLRAAELARPSGTPLLGVNLGHVGFLAEAEVEALDTVVGQIVDGSYDVEERLTLEVTVRRNGEVLGKSWALNECSVEKGARERMLEVVVEIDGRPLSRWGCDGVIFATPTGSTAYAFSSGGPVVWPEVEALLLVPISAHALFSRPLVASPSSVLALEVLPGPVTAFLSCDGRRTLSVPPGGRVEVRRGAAPVRVARINVQPFTDRLVAKFHLPVEGWRGRRT